MSRRTLSCLTLGLALSIGSAGLALAAPPNALSLDAMAAGGASVKKPDPKADARHGLEQLGMLDPLFGLCKIPVSVSEPYRELETMIATTARARGVATKEELTRWHSAGEALSRKKWAQATANGVSPAVACLEASGALRQEEPLIKDTLKKLKGFAASAP